MQRAGPLLLTALVAAAGGGLFAWLGLPAAWLAGAMVAVAIAALAGAPMTMPAPLRNAAFVLLGTTMGAGVTPETLQDVAAWPLSLALLAGSVAATTVACTLWLGRMRGWDPATARFSSIPGAMAVVVLLAATTSANVPRVALSQSIRLFTLVAVLPSLVHLWSEQAGAPVAPAPIATAGPVDMLIMLPAGVALAWALHALRVPGGVLLGALLASAALHATGIVVGRLPAPLTNLGFVATGAVIGCRFRGTPLQLLRETVLPSLEAVLLALLLASAFAALGALWLGAPFGQLLLAYAPGGIEAMAIMALALGLDAAFVVGHHVLRFVALNTLAPLFTRGLPRAPEDLPAPRS